MVTIIWSSAVWRCRMSCNSLPDLSWFLWRFTRLCGVRKRWNLSFSIPIPPGNSRTLPPIAFLSFWSPRTSWQILRLFPCSFLIHHQTSIECMSQDQFHEALLLLYSSKAERRTGLALKVLMIFCSFKDEFFQLVKV